MKNKIGVGVIGLGFMGSMHARIFNDIPNVELVCVSDSNEEILKREANILKVPGYTDYRELINNKQIDAISICVPDDAHLEPTLFGISKGKAIFLEKPISTRLEEADRMITELEKTGVLLTVGHILRFDSRYVLLKQALDSGELGDPIYVYTRRNSPINHGPQRYAPGTSLTFHVAIHDIDLINWYMNRKAIKVYAKGTDLVLRSKKMHDVVFATITYEDGRIANMEYNWILPANSPTHIDAQLELVGNRGVGYVNCVEQGLSLVTPNRVIQENTTNWPQLGDKIVGYLKEELMDFVDCVITNRKPKISAQEAREAVKVALAIERSLKEERIVDV